MKLLSSFIQTPGGLAAPSGPARYATNDRLEFFKLHGFHEVGIGALSPAKQPIPRATSRRQHDNCQLRPMLPQRPRDGQTIYFWKPQI